jgi:hypothetical protein
MWLWAQEQHKPPQSAASEPQLGGEEQEPQPEKQEEKPQLEEEPAPPTEEQAAVAAVAVAVAMEQHETQNRALVGSTLQQASLHARSGAFVEALAILTAASATLQESPIATTDLTLRVTAA